MNNCITNCECEYWLPLVAKRGTTFEYDIDFTHTLEGETEELPTDITQNVYTSNLMNLEVIAPNKLRMHFTAEEMALMALGDYNYDIRETMPGQISEIIIEGILTVKKDYTRYGQLQE